MCLLSSRNIVFAKLLTQIIKLRAQLEYGHKPIFLIWEFFECAVYIPIACTKMSPQRKLGIYVGFDSPSIIKYLKPLMDDVFTILSICWLSF